MSKVVLSAASWDKDVPDPKAIQVEIIDHFDARGMTRLYGRGDHYRRVFNLDMWTDKRGRVLARFWSRCRDVDGESYEVTGMRPPSKPIDKHFDEAVVPAKIRKEYDIWIISNF